MGPRRGLVGLVDPRTWRLALRSSCCWYMYICFWTSYCLLLLLLLDRGVGLLGPETGVTATLEFCEDAKLAGWKRGKEGSLRWAAGPVLEAWREVGAGRRRG